MTQRELAVILGRGTSCRISLLENGKTEPCVKEIIIFGRIFQWPFENLWPQWSVELEESFQSGVMRLVDKLQQALGRNERQTIRIEKLLRRLESILENLPLE